MMSSTCLVFVYGTLKRGEPNHKTLSETAGTYRFVGSGKTSNKFPLVIATRYNCAMVLEDPGKGYNVRGELYEVDHLKLKALDDLEGHPHLYFRKQEQILMADGTVVSAGIYVITKWRSDLLETSTEMLDSYSSNGSHGRPFNARYVQAKNNADDGYDMYKDIKGVALHRSSI